MNSHGRQVLQTRWVLAGISPSTEQGRHLQLPFLLVGFHHVQTPVHSRATESTGGNLIKNKKEHNCIVLMDTYSHTLELTIHYLQQPWPHLRSISPPQPSAAPNTQLIAELPFAGKWEQILRHDCTHRGFPLVFFCLPTYLPSICLSFIYLIYLSACLSLVLFLWKTKKLMNTDASHHRNPTDTPQPCMQMLTNPAVLKRDARGVLSSGSLKVWQSPNSAEGKTTTLEFVSIRCTVSVPIPHHVQSPLALTLDSVEIPHCVAGACPASMARCSGSWAGTSLLLSQALHWALLLKISSFIVMSCPEHRS